MPLTHLLAAVGGVFNAIQVDGDLAGQTLYYGRGAGRVATSSAVLSDLADVARDLGSGQQRRTPVQAASRELKLQSADDVAVRCYLRLTLLDKPGMLARR